MAIDRRSGKERRASSRYPVELAIEWDAGAGRMPGSISDVSLDGCFVLSSGEVNDGDSVMVSMTLLDGRKVLFEGRITNHVFDIGFGVRFEKLTADQRDLLIKMVHGSGNV